MNHTGSPVAQAATTDRTSRGPGAFGDGRPRPQGFDGVRYRCPRSGIEACGICGTTDGHRYEEWVLRGDKVPSCPKHELRLERVR